MTSLLGLLVQEDPFTKSKIKETANNGTEGVDVYVSLYKPL